jgi:hypothetical protein
MNLNTISLPWRLARPKCRWWKCTMYTLHACTPPGASKATRQGGQVRPRRFRVYQILIQNDLPPVCNSGHDTLNLEKYLLTYLPTYLPLEPQVLQSFYSSLPLGGKPITTILSRPITFSTHVLFFFSFGEFSQPGWKRKTGWKVQRVFF